jgi:hypothetical protein
MATIPTVQFLQFDIASDPSGVRNLSASAIKELDTSANGFLDFGNNNIASSGIVSSSKMLIFRATDMGGASGIYDMKFYISSTSAFTVGTFRFLHDIQRHYQGTNFALTTSSSDIPTSLPGVPNVSSTQNLPAISGITDADVSEYIYLAVFTETDVPFGTYGGGGLGSFRYRMQYNFS